jgi:hypothetical protein
MGTCNYTTQKGFDLYTFDTEYINELQYELDITDTYREATQLADILSEDLIFHRIEIGSGYYSGIQTLIDHLEWHNYYDTIEDMDNSDCQYYFDMCRSKAIAKYYAEINKINNKILPKFKELGFEHIRCVGVFSNGEAIYERVA